MLKKPGLDQSDMTNFRPITNLPTLSKILERLALRRLRHHVMTTGNFSKYQSAYRTGHSTETALLKVVNDVITSVCHQEPTVLLSLDISAAFDTIDHNILTDRITREFGISGCSHFSLVACSTLVLVTVSCLSGVPQGSVLGPLLFAMYISPVDNVVAAHNLHQHQYADDTQLYMAVRPSTDFQLHWRCFSVVPGKWFAP